MGLRKIVEVAGLTALITMVVLFNIGPSRRRRRTGRIKALLGVIDGVITLLGAGLVYPDLRLRFELWYNYQQAYGWPVKTKDLPEMWRKVRARLSDMRE